MRYVCRLIPLLCLGLPGFAPCGYGDVVELDSGGRVAGQIAKQDSPSREKVLVLLPDGGRILLNRTDVARTVEQSPDLLEYQRRAAQASDTAKTHMAVAMWCRERKLTAQFKDHLARVLELDPDNAEARKLLGFSQHAGRWLTRDELMESRGLVRYGRDYRTAQEIALLERKKHGAESVAIWRKRLERWRRDLSSSKPQEAIKARHSFETLTDPAAANALVRLLNQEANYEVQVLLLETAAHIDHPSTVQVLATLSLNDPRYDVRQQCLEHLVKAQRPGLAEIYTRALTSKDNFVVNQAGEALRVLGADQTISPLIKALTTKHVIKLGDDQPQQTYGMDSRGGFQFGGGKAPTKTITPQNPQVLSALVEITGQNFGFDKEAWNRWLDARSVKETVDLRRDE